MRTDTPPELGIVRRDERLDFFDYRRLRRELAAGSWVRVITGVYVPARQWNALTPIERHRVRVIETSRRMRPGAAFSHRSAAALHGMDILGPWPETVDVIVPRATGGRSTGAIRRHAFGLERVGLEPFGEHELTTPAQTALDLARTLPLVHAVGVVDQAIWVGRRGGPLTTLEEIADLMDHSRPQRGDARAHRVFELTNPESSNVRESQSFVVVVSLGFPRPLVQYRRVLRSGRLAIADLYFVDEDHWCEVDGRGKYLSPEFGPERDAATIVIDEKNRENEIRREVRGFSRWEATLADRPAMLYDLLTGDGMRSSRRRPSGR